MPGKKTAAKVSARPKTKIRKSAGSRSGAVRQLAEKKSVSKKEAGSSIRIHVGPVVSPSVKRKTVKPKDSGRNLEVRTGPAKAEVASEKGTGKPKVAIVSLTSCEGCQFALLDLGEKFLNFVSQIEMMDFRLLEDEEDAEEQLDVAIVEGNPVTKENLRTLQRLRKRAKILVVLGNCAAMGGIPEIKNYQEGKNTVKHVYRYIQGVDNPDIREVDNFVKVDFTFPGCPITADEFLEKMPLILEAVKTGNLTLIPKIPDQPVCVQCRQLGNRCLLLDKKPCFGPMILGGCHAVCPSSRMMCQGCRGLRPTGNTKAMRATLKNMMTDEEFENVSEIYGLRDGLEEREKLEK